jgi:hypothetical protein
MQFCESPPETGADGLHAPFYTRPATRLKRKVWHYCIKFCARHTAAVFRLGGRISPAKPFPGHLHPFLAKTV